MSDAARAPAPAQPRYDSSCSILLSTQSNSPPVTLTPQCEQLPAMLTASGAAQLGQFFLLDAAPLRFAERIRVQYSLYSIKGS